MNKALSINWEITKKCNLHCVYCRVRGGEEKSDELTEEQAKAAVDALFSAGYRHLKFTGGEPLIKEYFWKLVDHAHRKGMFISVFTNGTLITDAVLPKFKKYISVVAISLDTLDDAHGQLLKRPKSEFIINKIKKLRDLGIPVVISVTVTKITVNDLSGIIEFAKSYGVTEIKINDFAPEGRAGDNLDMLTLDKPLLRELSKIRTQIQKTFHEAVPSESQFRCECSDNDLFISYQGDLYPCVELSYISEDYRLGNIVKDRLSDLLELNRKFYQQIKDSDLCGYSYASSKHFSTCLNRSTCPKSFEHYMKTAKVSV